MSPYFPAIIGKVLFEALTVYAGHRNGKIFGTELLGVLSATQNAGALQCNRLAKRSVRQGLKVPKPALRGRDLGVKPIQGRAAHMDRCTRESL